ncbi:MAG: hypothetical protein AABY87_12090 [bacterium]
MNSFVAWLVDITADVWCSLSAVLNSNFSIALVGSLAGAFAGAVAAQRVIERNKQLEIFLSELRNTNAAIMVSFSICNIMLSLKKQHSLPLYEQFKHDQAAQKSFTEKHESGQLKAGEKFEYVADLKTFSVPAMPVDTLKDLVFNKVSAHGRPLCAVAMLEGAFIGLKEVLSTREILVEQFKTAISEEAVPYYYFGLRMPSGHTNQEYPDLIEAMHSYINDVIFFSSLLCNDLMEHGNRFRSQEKKFAKKAPKVNTADFSTPRASELMPPSSEYSDWLNGFIESNEKRQ